MNYWTSFTDNKISPKKLTVPEIAGISSEKSKLDFSTIGKKLYSLVGLELNPLSQSFGRAGKGQPGAVEFGIGDKWNVGLWHDMSRPFSSNKYQHEYSIPQEPHAEVGMQVSRNF